MLRIKRIADANPDPGSQTNADPDPDPVRHKMLDFDMQNTLCVGNMSKNIPR